MNPDPTLALTENCPNDGVHLSVLMRFEVLPKKILAVVVAVWRSHGHVNMLASRNVLGAQVRGSHRALMVELDENDRTVNSVVEDCVVARSTDPSEGGPVQMLLDLVHANSRMSLAEITHVETDKPQKLLLLTV